MISKLLIINFALSHWFSVTKNKIVPGAAYMFLTTVACNIVTFWLVVLKLYTPKIDPLIASIICMISILGIMYGFQTKVEKMVINNNLLSELKRVDKKIIYARRFAGIFVLFLSFSLAFVVLVLMF